MSLRRILVPLALVLLSSLAEAQSQTQIPEGYELIFSGSQDPATENLRFRTAYDSSATVGIYSAATPAECAGICDTRDACEGFFYQIPTSVPSNNCRALSIADEQTPRGTVTRSLSMRRLPRSPPTTDEPPNDGATASRDRLSITDLHWGWWVFFTLIPLIIYLIVICCIKCREKEEDDYIDDKAKLDIYQVWNDDNDLENGLVYTPSSSRRESQNSLALAQPCDVELAFFYETVTQNMKEESRASDSDTDTEYFARGLQESEYDADKFMRRSVVTAERQQKIDTSYPIHQARQSLLAAVRPQLHFYPMMGATTDLSAPFSCLDNDPSLRGGATTRSGPAYDHVISTGSPSSDGRPSPDWPSSEGFEDDFGGSLLDLEDSELTDSDLLEDASFA
jgi:hypothetical protein